MNGIWVASRVRVGVRSCPGCGYQFVEIRSTGEGQRGRTVAGVVLCDHTGSRVVDVCPGCGRVSGLDNTHPGARPLGEALRRVMGRRLLVGCR